MPTLVTIVSHTGVSVYYKIHMVPVNGLTGHLVYRVPVALIVACVVSSPSPAKDTVPANDSRWSVMTQTCGLICLVHR